MMNIGYKIEKEKTKQKTSIKPFLRVLFREKEVESNF